MLDDPTQDVKAHAEKVVSAKTNELSERITELLYFCSKETNVRDESDAARVQLAGIEMRFLEVHTALIEANNGSPASSNCRHAS